MVRAIAPRLRIVALALAMAGLAVAFAGGDQPSTVTRAEVEAAVAEMFKSAAPAWKARLVQDETQRVCSQFRNAPPPAEQDKIIARETAAIVYPDDGKILGDWKKGETIAQTGTGGQFSDDPGLANGGNCYACHQMAKSEISFGTLGPSLEGYGTARTADPAATRAAYAKIYDAQSVLACSTMPRFGANRVLTVAQIKDITAYLMSPDSPVNKGEK